MFGFMGSLCYVADTQQIQSNYFTIKHVNTNIDNTCTLHRHSQLDNTIQLTYHNIH